QLTVGFDAWRSVQTGQLQAGRITFVAPDIRLKRYFAGSRVAPSDTAIRKDANPYLARLLQRWSGGRIDVEGGTLRVPDPEGAASELALQIRHASLRRSQRQWNAAALIFLPDRLGHTVRVAAQ